jgi:hypothetical protein
MKRKPRTTVSHRQALKKAAENIAAKDGVAVTQCTAIARAEQVGAAEFFAERGKCGDVERAIAFLVGRSE